MKLAAQILSASEQERIHEQSLRILSEVGVRFHGRLAPQILQRHGVPWEAETKTARIPQEIVEHALQLTPKRFTLGARNPRYSVELPAGKSYYAIDGTAAFTQDFTQVSGYGCQDIEECASSRHWRWGRWPGHQCRHQTRRARARRRVLLMARFSSNTGSTAAGAAQAPTWRRLALIMGGEESLRQSSAYSLIYCPVAPLTHDGEMLDAYLELGAWNLPVMMMPMPVCGTTGPASLYSTIALANAEALSSIVIFELAHPGRALIYASATGVVDFRSGAYLAGVPEMGIMSGALTEMGKFYGMPTGSAGMTSDAKQPGAQACIEKLITTLPAALAGSDLIVGLGEIESDQLLVLEQLIVDHEIARLVERLAAGVDGAMDKELFEDIQTVGPGGHFLKSKNTRRLAHSDEFYYSKLIDHSPFEAWVGLGKPEMYAKARQEVERILAEPLADALPEGVVEGLEAILERAERELPED
jgi:trimethylamine--corrinoid protein Co-methyltransferase